ncbi:hypothetical protein EK21DRAFT_100336 [Setomelanomma holmii]|uniref:Uncharacterized protein n=1 Tax=Setomelanomma holmii TaxID=210430 RepID=A0A9P4H9B9_9PLEO|nr:hypothetical protein EK21DRAFT_100336 [Setomelanomma holmii]
MSADLFAEFAADTDSSQAQPAPPSRPKAHQAPSFSFFDSFDTPPPASVAKAHQPPQQRLQSSAPVTVSVLINDDNDEWGDFEGDPSTVQPAQPTQQYPSAFDASPAPVQQHLSIPQRPAAVTQDSFAFVAQQSTRPEQQSWQKALIIKAKKSADPSVLFDAEDAVDDDDNFGEFEAADTRNDTLPPPAASSALADLLGDLSVSGSKPPPAATSGHHDFSDKQRLSTRPTKKRGSVGGFGITSSNKSTIAPTVALTTPSAAKDSDGWDTFDDWEASIPAKMPAQAAKKVDMIAAAESSNSGLPAPIISPLSEESQPGDLPPTNVPPPGVLLSLFPSLFVEAQEKLFKPMAAQPLPMRNKLMAEPATIAYLQGYLILANVAAHIIAGRKLRWKRDQHLSQGMRIGPASSRATSGMKLTGVDKGENLKEEREVSDVIRAWKEQVGRLRHVVSGVNQIKASTLERGPDLQEAMPVKTLKQAEGGIPARQPCMLCGLKRDERVTAADMSIDDSFGEWWIDQVNMHRGCRNLWNQHKDALRQR